MEELEEIYFEIISNVGEARSYFIQAIQTAKEKKIDEARNFIEKGYESYKKGHASHFKLVQMEADDVKLDFSLILVHAEDQLMAADTFKILANEFIDLYKVIYNEN